MCEQKSVLYFDASYTLDVFCFLDMLFLDVLSRDESIVTHFEVLLSSGCSKILRNARKRLPDNGTFLTTLLPIISADPEFNELRLSELLGSPKYLITQLKKHPTYKGLPKDIKKFIRKDAVWVIEQLAVVIAELEKAKFKTFWIQERLPLLKLKLKQYEKEIVPLRPVEQLNECLKPSCKEELKVYLLSFYEGDSNQLLNRDIITSVQNSSTQVVKAIVDQTFSTIKFENELKLLAKQLKANPEIMKCYELVKGEHKQLTSYLECSINLAAIVYFYQKFHVLDRPYEYLGRYNFGSYKLSILFYRYLELTPKKSEQLWGDYVKNMISEVELGYYEQYCLQWMNQQS